MGKVKRVNNKAKQNSDRVKLNRDWKSIMFKENQSNQNVNHSNDFLFNASTSSSSFQAQQNTHTNLSDVSDVRERLRRWALKYNISKCAVIDLLKILICLGMNDLPRDSRSLFETPRSIDMSSLTNGKLWYVFFCIRELYMLNE